MLNEGCAEGFERSLTSNQKRGVHMKRKEVRRMVLVFFVVFTFVVPPLTLSAAEKKQITRKMLLGGQAGRFLVRAFTGPGLLREQAIRLAEA
jgi:hypothetical protein